MEHLIGRVTAPVHLMVTRDAVLAFARAIGEQDPRCTDLARAHELGEPDLLAPPTFVFSVEMAQPEPFSWLTSAGIALTTVLHAGQAIQHLAPVHAGDTLTACSWISDVRRIKPGALTLIDRRTDVARADALVARLTMTMAVVKSSG